MSTQDKMEALEQIRAPTPSIVFTEEDSKFLSTCNISSK